MIKKVNKILKSASSPLSLWGVWTIQSTNENTPNESLRGKILVEAGNKKIEIEFEKRKFSVKKGRKREENEFSAFESIYAFREVRVIMFSRLLYAFRFSILLAAFSKWWIAL